MKPRTIVLMTAIAATAGCGGTGRPAAQTRPAPTVPTASTGPRVGQFPPDVAAESSQTPPAGSPATSRTTARPPPLSRVSPPSMPARITATPSRGPVGTPVHIDGTGFTDAQWRAGSTGGTALWLASGSSGCGLYAAAVHAVRVTAEGRLSGEFVVPATGVCRQSTLADIPLRPGHYQIIYQCTACTIGFFDVTPAVGGRR